MLNLETTLRELVAIPSVNPMGGPAGGPECFEGRLTDYLEVLFHRLGLATLRQTVETLPQLGTKRQNLIARIPGDPVAESGGPLLLWEVHQDTVPADDMTVSPFSGPLRDGRLYGRGACDVKGGMTSMLAAVARLVAERPPRMPTVVLACTVNEEHGFSGASKLCELWTRGPSDMFPRPPDAAIVAEPTQLDVVVAHKGVVRWRCHTTGRAAHSSQPESGENAIYKMSRVLEALECYARDVVPGLSNHDLCGGPSLSVGTIQGGLSVNTVPDRCTIEIDRRLTPSENPSRAFRAAVEFVQSHCFGQSNGEDELRVMHDEPFLVAPGLADDHNGPLADWLCKIVRETGGAAAKVGAPYGTDAAAIAATGIPTVVFGPGSIEQAHTADEWIELAQVERAAEILFRLGCELVAVSR